MAIFRNPLFVKIIRRINYRNYQLNEPIKSLTKPNALDTLNSNISKLAGAVTSFGMRMNTGGAHPLISGITLTNSQFNGGSASGTVVGNIGVTTIPANVFSGSLGLSGTDRALFQIVGNQLQTNGVLPAGTYDINIVATQTNYRQSPFSQNFPITGITTQVFSSLTLDNFSFASSGTSTSPVGNVIITMNPTNPTSTAIISLGGADAGSFVLTNGGQYPCQVQAKQNIGPGTYHIILTATQPGISNSPFPSSVLTITGTSLTGSVITTETFSSLTGSAISSGAFPQMRGFQFRKTDIPTGQWPQLQTTTGQQIPITIWNESRWSDGSYKHCGMLIGQVPTTIATTGTTINVLSGGTNPALSASGFTDAQLYAEGISVNITGFQNLSGTWSALLNGDAKTIRNLTLGDGPAGRVKKFTILFQQSGVAHDSLVCDLYVQELRNPNGTKAGYRVLPRVIQPWYNSGTRAIRGLSAFNITWTGGGGGTVTPALPYTPNTIVTEGPDPNVYGATSCHTTSPNDWWTGQGRFDGQAPELAAIYGRFTSGSGFSLNTVVGISAYSNGSGASGGTHISIGGSVSGSGVFNPCYVVFDWSGCFGATTAGKYQYIKGSGTQTAAVADPSILMKFDPIYRRKTRFFPPYRALPGDTAYTPFSPTPSANSWPYSWGPWQTGLTAVGLDAGGEHEWIGPLQAPQARHYYNQTQVDDTLARTLGLAITNFATCIRDRTSAGFLNVSSNAYGQGVGPPASGAQWSSYFWNGTTATGFPANPANGNPSFRSSGPDHYPTGAYYAYLITGEPQYTDLQIESSIGGLIAQYYQNPVTPTFAVAAVGVTCNGEDGPRTIGWCLREFAYAAAIMPDVDPVDPGGANGPVKYVKDNWARNIKYQLDTFNAGNSYTKANGLWLPKVTITRQWMRGYVMSAIAAAAGVLEDANALAMIQNQATWYNHVAAITSPACNYGDNDIYYNPGGMGDYFSGVPITADNMWGNQCGAPTGFIGGLTTPGGSPALFTMGNVNPAMYTPQNGDCFVISSREPFGGGINGAQPSGISYGQDYYVRNLVHTSGNVWTCNLSATPSGALINVGGSGGSGDGSLGMRPLASSVPATSTWGDFASGASNLNEIGGPMGWMQAVFTAVGSTSNLTSVLADRDTRRAQTAALFQSDPKWAIGSKFE